LAYPYQEYNPYSFPSALEALSDEDIMSNYDRVRAQHKLLENRKSALGQFLQDRMNKTGKKVIETETFKAAMRQNKHDDYDTATVLSPSTPLTPSRLCHAPRRPLRKPSSPTPAPCRPWT
jgi:hypothetical protein